MSKYEASAYSINLALDHLDRKQKYWCDNMGDEWGMDSDGWRSLYKPNSDYNATFKNMVSSFDHIISERKHSGRSAHILDLFGSGKFFVDNSQPDSVLGIRSKDILPEEDKLARPHWWKVMEGNIYNFYPGRKNSTLIKGVTSFLEQQGADGFDLISCRPGGPFDHTAFLEEIDMKGELMDIYNNLLNIFYGYLSSDGGEMYTSFPSFGLGLKPFKNFVMQARMQNHTLQIAEESGLVQSTEGIVLKITKTPTSPPNFNAFPCINYTDRDPNG
jgi:hypothetical protein